MVVVPSKDVAVHMRRDLFKAAIVVLVVWLLGVFGVFGGGDLVLIFLLVGLMLLLLAMLKARDAAIRPPGSLSEK